MVFANNSIKINNLFFFFWIFPLFLNFGCNYKKKEKLGDLALRIHSLIDSSNSYHSQSHFNSAINILDTAIYLIKIAPDCFHDSLPKIYNLRAKNYRIIGAYVRAWKDYKNSLDIIGRRSAFKHEIFNSYFGLGTLFYYYNQQNNKIAIDYINKAYANAITKTDSALIYYFKCEAFIVSRKVDTAGYFLDSLEKIINYDAINEKFHSNDSSFYMMEPWIWEDSGKIKRMITAIYSSKIVGYFDKSLKYNYGYRDKRIFNKYQIAFLYFYKGDYYLNFDNYLDSAHIYLDSAYKMADKMDIPFVKMLSSKGLKIYYSKRNDTLNANKFLFIENNLTIELNNDQLMILQLESELKSKEEATKYKAYIIFILLLTAFAFVCVGIFLKKRKGLDIKLSNAIKKLEGENIIAAERNEKWNNIQNELLKQKDAVLKESGSYDLTLLVKLIGEYFKSEYCGVGLSDKHELANWFNYDINASQHECICRLQNSDFDKEIASDISKNVYLNGYSVYVERDIYSFSSEYIKIFAEGILRTNSVTNIIFVGIYSESELIDGEGKYLGYLSILNAKEDYGIKNEINILGKQLSHFFNIAFDRRINETREKDRQFINGLREYKDNFDNILNSISEYFTREFNLATISFRVPVLNGSELNSINLNNLLFPLRFLYVDPLIYEKKKVPAEKIKQLYIQKRKVLNLSELNYKDELINNFPSSLYFDNQMDIVSFGSDFDYADIFETNEKIVLAIRKTIYNEKSTSDANECWKNLYGVFNLRPYKIIDNIEIENRLVYLGHHITHTINGIINEKKHAQINTLKQEIDNLQFTPEVFYQQIARLVSKVINAEICSVFIYDKSDDKLKLKGTTALKALYNNKAIDLNNRYLEDIYYNSQDTESVTTKVLTDGLVRLIYSIEYHPVSKKFEEIPMTGSENDYSILYVPLKDKNRKTVGVIKCFGKIKSSANLINSFWNFDKETIELVAALSERFIENAEFDKVKDKFIKEVVHESLTPMTEILYKSQWLVRKIEQGDYKSPKEFLSFLKSIEDGVLLYKYVILGLETASKQEINEGVIKIEKTNMRELILDVVRLFDELALFNNNIIKTNISNIPEINIDKLQIYIVIINLLSNAIHYSNPNSEINIYYKYTHERFIDKKYEYWHEIKFVNNGIGILQNEENNVFRLYHRSRNAIKKRPSGTGIGLYLINRIMTAHSGLCIIRKLNNPTEISVLFPQKNEV
jgi:hypothetical protein